MYSSFIRYAPRKTFRPTCSSFKGHFTHQTETCFMDYRQKPSLVGRLKTKPGDHGTLNAHIYWFISFNHARGPT